MSRSILWKSRIIIDFSQLFPIQRLPWSPTLPDAKYKRSQGDLPKCHSRANARENVENQRQHDNDAQDGTHALHGIGGFYDAEHDPKCSQNERNDCERSQRHWSTRTMARAADINEASVRRIWHTHGPKPHRIESFKVSNDPDFAAKLEDVVGIFLNPPEHALVLSVDEKSQIQALDRTQSGLPMKKGRGATTTHDYKRNRTTTLFAALNTDTGEVYHLCQQRHRHHEWLKFLRLTDQTVASEKQIHIICDNYATHKHERVQRWMARHKHFHVHFTPTSESWLNMIERFLRDLTENRIRRGVFQYLEHLIVAIGDYIDRHNDNPKPFIWTAKANDILEKVTRAQAVRNKRLSV